MPIHCPATPLLPAHENNPYPAPTDRIVPFSDRPNPSIHPYLEKRGSTDLYCEDQKKELENDAWTVDKEEEFTFKVKVLKEEKQNYTLEILYENIAMRSARKLYATLDEEMSGTDLKLIYRIDRATGNAELTNWKEAQAYMNNSFDQMDHKRYFHGHLYRHRARAGEQSIGDDNNQLKQVGSDPAQNHQLVPDH